MKLLKILFLQVTFFISTSSLAFAQDLPINVTFFGSSVCYGTGAKDDHGYAWQFFHSGAINTTQYHYRNASTGGDNTLIVEKQDRLTTKLLPTHPKIVVIGLSLGNEGIGIPKDEHGREQVLEQFRSRLLALADSLKSLHLLPVIVNCYANNNFDQVQYGYTKQINRIINTWNYPSINVLGAVDDLTGKWVGGYAHDALHPNTAGHLEMSYSIVPSMFAALLSGKKIPHYDWNNSYTTLLNTHKTVHPLSIAFKHPIHSFTLSFRFKNAKAGSIAGWVSNKQSQSLKLAAGQLRYRELAVNDAQDPDKWTHVVLSHSYANQKTQLFVNGRLIGSVKEQLSPEMVFFGGSAASIALKDVSLHRAALNESEALDLFNKKFIQSSLEFYNPLTRPTNDNRLENEAQSTTQLKIDQQVILKQQQVDF
ncbi:MAG: GDSL-type esterase/lipase family protein [Sphingobacteriaceae bacterium]